MFSVLVFVSLIFSSVIPSFAQSFSDVTSYEEEIGFLTSRGIIKGYPDGTFKPKNPIKRIQAVQMILREMGIEDFTAPDPNFRDMEQGDYGYEEVSKAVSLGFIGGKTDVATGEKFFDPNGTLTRAQMAKILVEAYRLSGSYPYNFIDVAQDNWAYHYVSALAGQNITTGYPDFSFKPNTKLSRQHFAVFMARMLNDEFKPNPELSAHFIDVGQGDSILVLAPNGKTMLVDGGKRDAGDEVVAYLHKLGINTIDVMVSTHPDSDHIGGLIDVLEQVDVKQVVDSGKSHTTQTYYEYLNLIDVKNIPYQVPGVGDLIHIDENVKIQVLNSGKETGDNNESSIVLKVSYGEIDYLLTGDAGIESEKVMGQVFDVSAEILKVSHHGSDTGSNYTFIQMVHPEAAIFSYGKNNYGHPDPVIVQRMKNVSADLYSTYESGDIIVKTNGENYTVSVSPWDGQQPPVIEEPPVKPEPPGTGTGGSDNGKTKLVSVDLDKEIAAIKNSGTTAVDMTGWKLVSVEGNQTYYFPNGYQLKAGATVYVTSGRNAKEQLPTYLKWTGAYIWNNEGDAARLYNSKGVKVSEIQ
ncbi:S-layer homology domain-containing protein [Cytobacillus oceanisediminis]|uniref:S-layer homology domain-containing protein n=1 Tax=Cytobacillus oceanisediminis TaxID=665099 RepID=UPI003736D221